MMERRGLYTRADNTVAHGTSRPCFGSDATAITMFRKGADEAMMPITAFFGPLTRHFILC